LPLFQHKIQIKLRFDNIKKEADTDTKQNSKPPLILMPVVL